jgi:hypothetical protein
MGSIQLLHSGTSLQVTNDVSIDVPWTEWGTSTGTCTVRVWDIVKLLKIVLMNMITTVKVM